MIKRITVFNLLIALLFTGTAVAQNFRVTGKLINSDDQQPLAGATVKLSHQRDTSLINYTTSNQDGVFAFELSRRGAYKLLITYVGFESYTGQVAVTMPTVDLGAISIKPEVAMLKGVSVDAVAVRAEQKGDTTQYNAAGFKVTQDATTEDLVKKMPGITIEDGKVKAHGEEVKKILVDGKQFFGDDPSVTLKNLPAEVVDKIQVFDKLSDQAAWTGFDDGSGQKTMNIVTRQQRNNGQFGKFTAGYGSNDRYILGANYNYFKGQERITLLGLTNNINQMNFSADDLLGSSENSGQGAGRFGNLRGGGMFGVPSGINTYNTIGANYNNAWGSKITLNASYFLNNSSTITSGKLNRQYILSGEENQYYTEDNSGNRDNTNHRINARLEYNLDENNSFIFSPRLNLQKTGSYNLLQAETGLPGTGATNRTLNATNNNGDAFNFNNELLYRHKFALKGRTFSVNVTTGVNNRNSTNLLDARNSFAENPLSSTLLTDTIRQKGISLATGFTAGTNLTYTEPVGKKAQIQVNYNPSYSKNDNDKQTFDYITEVQEYQKLDTSLSNVYNYFYFTQKAGAAYLYQTDKLNFNAGLTYQNALLSGENTFPKQATADKSYNNILPNIMFNYKLSSVINWRLTYRASTNAPSISQLQEVVDNSNTLLLSIGNPNLKQEYRHFAMSRFSLSNKAKTSNLFAMLFFQKVNDYIGNSTFILKSDTVIYGQDVKRGSQLTKSVNLNGSWNGRALVSFGFPVKLVKSNFNVNSGVSYNNRPSLINDNNNMSRTLGINQGVVISSNISQLLDFTVTYNINYNLVKNTLQPQLNNNYFLQIGSAQLNWEFWKGFFVQNSITYQKYDGISSAITDQYTLWNASLGKKFLKNKSGELKLSCYDILNQNKSINRSVTDTYIEDSNNNVLQQYFMLSFTYNLRKFNGNKVKSEDFKQQRPEYPGPPPGGGYPPRPYSFDP